MEQNAKGYKRKNIGLKIMNNAGPNVCKELMVYLLKQEIFVVRVSQKQ